MFYKIHRKKMLRAMAFAMAVMIGATTGCKQDTNNKLESTKSDAVTFTDDMGREVTVDHPQRVVCLTSSFADIWHLAGEADKIVATTDATWRYFDLPLKDDVVNLGSSKEINLEQLIACEPDLVLASCGTDRNVELETILTELGIPTAYFDVDTIDDYLRMLDICTQITGYTENYERYGTRVKEQVLQAVQRSKKTSDTKSANNNTNNNTELQSPPTVLYIRATGSNCKVKNSKDSVLGEMLANLGCINIADSEDSLLEQLSLEVILEKDPDFIFVILQSADVSDAEAVLESTLLSNPAWASLTAVKEGRYHVLDANLYNMKPNARWGEAYEQLADILYPEP